MGNICAGAPEKAADTGALSPKEIEAKKKAGPPTPRAGMDEPQAFKKDEHEESNKADAAAAQKKADE